MPNMLDYLAWRGELTLAQDPLNEVDELILSQLAYVAFGEYIPGPTELRSVPLGSAVRWLLDHDPDAKMIHQTGFMWKNNLQLLEALRGSRRFHDMRLSSYVDSVSPKDEKQFAAMTVSVGDGTTLIAYRGTDDTLVGWKEDLNMAYACPVPAQSEAVRYLHHAAGRNEGPLRVMGHSKGGNLAVFAAASARKAVQARIRCVVSHDGPGHSRKTILSEGYGRIRDRLRVYIPHFSIVGMLLEHEENYVVVESDARTILQHDAFSWQVQGPRMQYACAPSEASLETNRIIRGWLGTLDTEHRRLFVEAVYEIASNLYGKTIPKDIENMSFTSPAVLAQVLKLEPKLRGLFTKSLGELFSTAVKSIRQTMRGVDN